MHVAEDASWWRREMSGILLLMTYFSRNKCSLCPEGAASPSATVLIILLLYVPGYDPVFSSVSHLPALLFEQTQWLCFLFERFLAIV